MARNTTFPKSRVLVLAVNAVQSLLPTTLIAQAESLLESHKVDELVLVVDERRKKLQARLTVDDEEVLVLSIILLPSLLSSLLSHQVAFIQPTDSTDDDLVWIQTEELYYVYQRLGFQYLSETRFEDAGYHLFEGNLDPRVLISYFPELRGGMFGEEEEMEVFEGVAEHMPPYESVEDIGVFSFSSSLSFLVLPSFHPYPSSHPHAAHTLQPFQSPYPGYSTNLFLSPPLPLPADPQLSQT